MSVESRYLYTFKDFRLDVGETALLRDGEEVAITPKAFQLLKILVENHGSVVKKDKLISEIWANSFVEEGNLAFTARLVRKALDDDAKHPTFIETVPRKGYRFIAEVSKDLDRSPEEVASDKPRRSYTLLRLLVAFAVITALVCAIFFVLKQGGLSLTSAPILSVPFHAERLTSAGNAFQTAISPNGMLVAYTDQANGKWSLWLRRLETAENIQILPSTDELYGGLVFSRDGNSLYFTRTNPDLKQLDIYRVNAFGGIPTKLFEKTEGWISISPDDRQISFVRCKYTRDDYCSLFVGKVDGSGETRLVARPEPLRIADNQFAPDGRTIAFASGQSRTGSDEFGLFSLELDTRSETQITSERFFNIKQLKWLPSGGGLLISARQTLSQKFSIWKIDAGSGAATQMTSDDANFSGLSLDSDGKALVATKVDGDFAIYVDNIGQHVPRKLAAGTSASFAPGGNLVYESSDHDIWMIDTDGSNKRQLTNSPFADICPLVSPDGRFIFFSSNRTGVNHVWRMNIDGSDQRQITRGEGGYARFVTPDGRWLYYRGGFSNSFRKIRTDGGEEQSAGEINKLAGAFSPDGKFLAAFDTIRGRGITIDIRNFSDQALVSTIETGGAKTEPLQLLWSADSKSVMFLVRDAGSYSLWRWQLDQPKPELVVNLGTGPIERITMSPDGSSVVTVQGRWLHDAYLITGLNK